MPMMYAFLDESGDHNFNLVTSDINIAFFVLAEFLYVGQTMKQ